MQKIIKRMVQAMALVAVILAVSVPASAAQIKVDGDPSDWSGVDMQSSDNGKIAKWAVLRDDKNVYFYVQQNGEMSMVCLLPIHIFLLLTAVELAEAIHRSGSLI